MLAAAQTLRSGWVAQGPAVRAFERELAELLEITPERVVAVSSGTAALYLALYALSLPEGARVGVPVYACSALRNAVVAARGIPVYVDSTSDHPNMDPYSIDSESVEAAIVAGLFGRPVQLQRELPFPVIEDIAQALGARIAGSQRARKQL
ncbi:MAG: DegT/DnrJ/EryC1/StrS family aminotransferase [Leptospiraceae bacterium]|nr:DegT/DnrJ/EryC1/StrS family aminotransferase [Leptospiraceae bacterium]